MIAKVDQKSPTTIKYTIARVIFFGEKNRVVYFYGSPAAAAAPVVSTHLLLFYIYFPRPQLLELSCCHVVIIVSLSIVNLYL